MRVLLFMVIVLVVLLALALPPYIKMIKKARIKDETNNLLELIKERELLLKEKEKQIKHTQKRKELDDEIKKIDEIIWGIKNGK